MSHPKVFSPAVISSTGSNHYCHIANSNSILSPEPGLQCSPVRLDDQECGDCVDNWWVIQKNGHCGAGRCGVQIRHDSVADGDEWHDKDEEGAEGLKDPIFHPISSKSSAPELRGYR